MTCVQVSMHVSASHQASIVERDIQSAECIDRHGHGIPMRILLRNIADHDPYLTAILFNFGCDLFQTVRPPCDEDERGPMLCEQAGSGSAYASTGSRNDRRFAVE